MRRHTGRFGRIWLWVLLAGLSLFLLSTNSVRSRAWNAGEKVIVETIAPLQNLISSTIRYTELFWESYFDLVNVRLENRRLKEEINALKMENSRYHELQAANERLRELLQFRKSVERPVVAARVIGVDPSGWFKSVIIDKGEHSGLAVNMPVVNAAGVVGRIVAVSNDYAKVLLIIDQNSAVDCLLQRSRDRGMVRGRSGDLCSLDYVVKSADVVPEDKVITSGLGGIFPKGLNVGHVSSLREVPGELFKDIELVPAVDFSKLEEVLVILKEYKPLDY